MAVRDSGLDLVRGMLVIGMLIGHATYPFILTDTIRVFIFPGLFGFVSGSWVMISGFIIGTYYRPKFSSARAVVTRRLIDRGCRLVAIFAVANVLLGQISLTCDLAPGFRDCDVVNVFLLGDLSGQAFEILLGIGYLLIVSPAFLWWPRLAVVASSIVFMLVAAAPFMHSRLTTLAWIFTCGSIGIITGSLVTPRYLGRLLSEPQLRRRAAVLAAGVWIGYTWLYAADMIHGYTNIAYPAYVMSLLAMLYLVSPWIRVQDWAGRELIFMARYPLLAYLVQMGILRALWLLVPGPSPYKSFPVVLAVALVLLLVSLHGVDYLRGRFGPVDKAYLAVFG